MSGADAVDGARVGGADKCSLPAQWREYEKDGITVRVPAELPTLTPQAAQTLLAIIMELGDKERQRQFQTEQP